MVLLGVSVVPGMAFGVGGNRLRQLRWRRHHLAGRSPTSSAGFYRVGVDVPREEAAAPLRLRLQTNSKKRRTRTQTTLPAGTFQQHLQSARVVIRPQVQEDEMEAQGRHALEGGRLRAVPRTAAAAPSSSCTAAASGDSLRNNDGTRERNLRRQGPLPQQRRSRGLLLLQQRRVDLSAATCHTVEQLGGPRTATNPEPAARCRPPVSPFVSTPLLI